MQKPFVNNKGCLVKSIADALAESRLNGLDRLHRAQGVYRRIEADASTEPQRFTGATRKRRDRP
jgi:hypothetical protein